jgi:HK97 family phage major capsid protein
VDPIQQKQERLAAIKDELQTYAKASKLSNRPFSAEELGKIDLLKAEAEALKADIAALEKDRENRSYIDSLGVDLSQANGRQTQPDQLAQTQIRVKEPEPFRSLGEQLQAIAGVALSGREDNRLKWESLAPASGAAVAGVPSDGGYLIQKDFSTELLSRMNEMGQVASRVRTINIGPNSDGLKLLAVDETSRATGSRWGGVQVYWGAEADAATAKKPKFRQMELELRDLIGLAYVTNRLLQDASALASVFMQAFSEEMSFMKEDALVNGTGAGQPLGVMNCPAKISVAKETGQAAATVVYENINKMWSRLWARSRANAVWLINQDVEPALDTMSLAIGTGGVPVYMPPGGAADTPYGRLKGRPVIPVEYCQTLGTAGDIILADFSQVIAIEKGGMQADSSIHVRFTTNENTFRFIHRYDAQPVWNSALTPFKGSATKSPFVVLDTRA